METFVAGIAITLTDRASSGLAAISSALLKANGASDQFQQKLNAMHGKMLAMQALGGIGSQMFRASAGFLDEAIDAGKEYVNVINQMHMKGLAEAEIQKNIAAATATSGKVFTTTYTENLKVLGDFMTILGKQPEALQEAREMLPHFQKSAAILRASAESPAVAARAEQQSFAMLKSIEMMSGKAPTADMIKHHVEMMTSVMTATGGRVLPSDYQNTLKYARQAKLTLDENFLYNVLPELIMEQKGNAGAGGGSGGPGAMIAAAFRLGVQGIMSKATAENLSKLTLPDGRSLLSNPTLKTTTTGTTVTGGGGLIDSEMFAKNSDKWTDTYLMPALKKKYPNADRTELLLHLATTFKGNQMATAFLGELAAKHPQFAKFKEIRQGQPGFEQQAKLAMKSPYNAEEAAIKQWHNVMLTIGTQVLPIVIPGLVKLAGALNQVGNFLQRHPIAATLIAVGAAGVALAGGLLMVGAQVGTLILVAGALGAPLAAIGAAMAYFGTVAVGVAAGFGAIMYASTHMTQIMTTLANGTQTAANAVIGLVNAVGSFAHIRLPAFQWPQPAMAAAGGPAPAQTHQTVVNDHRTINFNLPAGTKDDHYKYISEKLAKDLGRKSYGASGNSVSRSINSGGSTRP